MAVESEHEDPIDLWKGEIIPSHEIQKAAKLLLLVVNDPQHSAGFCPNCVPVFHERLLQLSLITGDVRIVNNTKETTSVTTSDFEGSTLTKEKPKLWSEEAFSSSESDGEASSSRHDCKAPDYERESKMFVSQNTKISISELEEVHENGVIPRKVQESNATTIRAFKNENLQFAWANVAITSHEARDELIGPPPPVRSKECTEVKDTNTLSREIREELRYHGVKRKKDFQCIEWVRGNRVNVGAGLELHMNVFSTVEQKRLVQLVEEYQEKGRNKLLKERTYSEPRKWMRGKGRVTIQFGCCYNYARDNKGNPPGIIHDDLVDPLPDLLRATIRRLVRWHVLPPTCIPDSCIINIYDEGDCIPPHIDHHDFLRPFCTLSLVSECNIVFGSELKITGPGEFEGRLVIPLPIGSVLVLNGNGADEAKHAVPAVPTKRISMTFRKMDPRKVPKGYKHPKDLEIVHPFKLTGIIGQPR